MYFLRKLSLHYLTSKHFECTVHTVCVFYSTCNLQNNVHTYLLPPQRGLQGTLPLNKYNKREREKEIKRDEKYDLQY